MECEKGNKCNRDLEVSWAIYSREWIFLATPPENKLHTSHSYAWCDTFQFLPNSLCSHLLAKLSICVCDGEREFLWIGGVSVGVIFVYMLL